MPKISFAGEPLHPILNDFPSALTPTSLIFDAIGLATGNRQMQQMARYALVTSLVSSIPAALAGFADYLEIPDDTEAKQTGNMHALLNVGLLGLTAVNVAMRSDEKPSGAMPMLLNAGLNVGLMVSGWYGAALIYKHGYRVEERVGIEIMPGSERMAGVLEQAEEPMPSTTDPSKLAERAKARVGMQS